MMEKNGTRAELIKELSEDAVAWHHFCKDELSEAASAGAADLEAGHESVKVGHTTYTVTD